MDIVSHLLTLIGGGGAGAVIWRWLKTSRKTDTTERLMRVSADWSERVLKRVTEVEQQIERMTAEHDRVTTSLRREIDSLRLELDRERKDREKSQAELAGLRALLEHETALRMAAEAAAVVVRP